MQHGRVDRTVETSGTTKLSPGKTDPSSIEYVLDGGDERVRDHDAVHAG